MSRRTRKTINTGKLEEKLGIPVIPLLLLTMLDTMLFTLLSIRHWKRKSCLIPTL